ncbi:MAG: leucine-rich repeat domain-containing protein [Bacteroidaceae bacterium]|nr:leucine-rich repeat domain-containing protein [Bacteroidaceae bacterium]
MKKLFTLLLGAIFPIAAHCYVGESFTVKTTNDVEMEFTILSEGEYNTVQTGGSWEHCIDWDYEGDVVVPAFVSYNGKRYIVTEIGHASFYRCAIRSISLPPTITTIREGGIGSCPYIQSLTIPSSVELIEEGAFQQNSRLDTLVVNQGNKNYVSIDNVLFNKERTILLQYACGLPDNYYTIPNTVNRIADYAFDWCTNLKEVSFPESVLEIGQHAFWQCLQLQRVCIPASIIQIGEGAFAGPNLLTEFEVDERNPVYTVVNGVLYTKDLSTIVCYPANNMQTNYDILNETNQIFDWTFASSNNLLNVFLPNTITRIGSLAFFACNNLQSIDIPASVNYIGSQAFDYCYNLTSVYFHSAAPPATSWRVFGGNENLVIYVPYTSIEAYRQVENLNLIHIDPAIDWHDDHWFWVFCCVEGIDFSQSEGITAYKVVENPDYSATEAKQRIKLASSTKNSSPIILMEIDKAGPGDCVLLKAEPGKTYALHSDADAPNLTDNLLTGATEETSVTASDGDKVNFVFNGTDFVPVVGSEGVAIGTGFLQIPAKNVAESTASLSVENIPAFSKEEIATNIHAIHAETQDANSYYNLQGVRTHAPRKGIYIVNGQKVFIK